MMESNIQKFDKRFAEEEKERGREREREQHSAYFYSGAVQKCANIVDIENMLEHDYFFEKSASIQDRAPTSLLYD